eukprot:1826415-Amphidinium_carterae.1
MSVLMKLPPPCPAGAPPAACGSGHPEAILCQLGLLTLGIRSERNLGNLAFSSKTCASSFDLAFQAESDSQRESED